MTTPIVPDYVKQLVDRAVNLQDMLTAVVLGCGGEIVLTEKIQMESPSYELEFSADIATRTFRLRAVPRPRPNYDDVELLNYEEQI